MTTNTAGRVLTGAGLAQEVDAYTFGGLKSILGTKGAPYNQNNVTHTITIGPTTTGPVYVSYGATVYLLPFGQSCGAPQFVWDQIDPSINPDSPWQIS
jgi:hypothetical protein